VSSLVKREVSDAGGTGKKIEKSSALRIEVTGSS